MIKWRISRRGGYPGSQEGPKTTTGVLIRGKQAVLWCTERATWLQRQRWKWWGHESRLGGFTSQPELPGFNLTPWGWGAKARPSCLRLHGAACTPELSQDLTQKERRQQHLISHSTNIYWSGTKEARSQPALECQTTNKRQPDVFLSKVCLWSWQCVWITTVYFIKLLMK